MTDEMIIDLFFERSEQAISELDKRHISDTAVFSPASAQSPPERSAQMKTKRIITLALAAALIIALGAAAYATGIFGLKTMAVDLEQQANIIPENTMHEIPGHTIISVSQPQAVEDTQDTAIKEKIDMVFSEEAAEALEGIAAKYDLRLRNQAELILQKDFSGRSGDLTREEIIQKVNEICAGGKSFFRTEPVAFDKFYYYDEGTFAVNFYVDDALCDGASCYLYNSPHGTFSSGKEVINSVRGDVDSFTIA